MRDVAKALSGIHLAPFFVSWISSVMGAFYFGKAPQGFSVMSFQNYTVSGTGLAMKKHEKQQP